MNNEERDRFLYKWPDSEVLCNKLGIHDDEALDRAERLLVTQRSAEAMPTGNYDLAHLQAIHKHLFQDVYDWAGEVRQTDIRKTDWFMPHERIHTAMNDVHKRLEEQNYLRGLSPDQFAEAAGPIFGDVNFSHPFREGNGRTQMIYFSQLAAQAGHDFDERRLVQKDWVNASIAANKADYDPMSMQIARGIKPMQQVKQEPQRTNDARSKAEAAKAQVEAAAEARRKELEQARKPEQEEQQQKRDRDKGQSR